MTSAHVTFYYSEVSLLPHFSPASTHLEFLSELKVQYSSCSCPLAFHTWVVQYNQSTELEFVQKMKSFWRQFDDRITVKLVPCFAV